MATVSFPYATLCVQGIKDGVTSEALEAQFEHYGRVRNVNLAQNKNMKGVPDTRIALVEFARRDDARKAMQELNGRNVQGKCVMIRFARSAPGMRSAAPAVRRGVPEPIPQTASHERLLAAKFRPADRSRSRSRSCSRTPRSKSRARGKKSKSGVEKGRSRSRRRRSRSPVRRQRSVSPQRSRSASRWRPEEFSSPEPTEPARRARRARTPARGSKRCRTESRSRSRKRR
eukprot:s735_g32.t1